MALMIAIIKLVLAIVALIRALAELIRIIIEMYGLHSRVYHSSKRHKRPIRFPYAVEAKPEGDERQKNYHSLPKRAPLYRGLKLLAVSFILPNRKKNKSIIGVKLREIG
jgi:hypothetical protein